MKEIALKIPATTANLGLGFDSMGLAVNKFLHILARPADGWHVNIRQADLAELPTNETNLVVQTAIKIAKQFDKTMPSLEIDMESEIPLAHGLGSSSSAIVAGLELANHYCDLDLSEAEKVKIATRIEGHPDNVGPCITGGGFVGYYDVQDKLYYHTFRLDGISLVVSHPNYQINTNVARQALPNDYKRSVAVQQNARNNVMLMSLLAKDYQTMGTLMMQDQLHEPYRQPLIKEFIQIKELALEAGAYATVISGAGPSVLTLCPDDKVAAVVNALKVVPDCQHEQLKVYYR